MSNYYIYCKKADFKQISETFHISPILARILRNRDLITEGEIREYLHGGTDDYHDPFLMKGVKEAVPLIFDAVSSGKKIRIIGDYDTDGICSSYLLKQYLRFWGADADIRLPDRMAEGYGMNVQMVEEAIYDGVRMILTCDNGVSAHEAVAKAKEAGLCVIVTDHHEVPSPLVNADVVIDPKQEGDTYPYKELCGAGVAYKLLSALHSRLSAEANERLDADKKAKAVELMEELLTFVAIATVADVVPLTGENRNLSKVGIRRLQQTKNTGLLALLQEKELEPQRLSSFHIAFLLAPCLNSAGRLLNANVALELLESTEESAAKVIASRLSALNEERKTMTEQQLKVAEEMLTQMQSAKGALPNILVLFLPDAHESIAGIIAGRLKEDYHRPAIVITKAEEGLKGSGRSVDAWNMIEEMRKFPQLFDKLGGHAKAAGFTLAAGVDAAAVDAQLNDACLLSEAELEDKKWIDMQLPFSFVSESLVEELDLLEPCGFSNPRAVFAQRNVKVHRILVLGKKQNVLKLQLEDEHGYRIDAIHFAAAKKIAVLAAQLIKAKETLHEDLRIGFTYFPSVNVYRNERSMQLRIMDFISIPTEI